ncbi:hypothetical protein CYMTET_56876 [Cymbomonas tetramitiformis]|uniref:Uncharacterized protein n=1 Tax=Cymbomonas tetramitiformis TaxID=36881 RepID=A0AAE0ELI8_9CHLO|nr:hypothetical protein CYMTET_56876 [Cymbomonas tetramitiformis]
MQRRAGGGPGTEERRAGGGPGTASRRVACPHRAAPCRGRPGTVQRLWQGRGSRTGGGLRQIALRKAGPACAAARRGGSRQAAALQGAGLAASAAPCRGRAPHSAAAQQEAGPAQRAGLGTVQRRAGAGPAQCSGVQGAGSAQCSAVQWAGLGTEEPPVQGGSGTEQRGAVGGGPGHSAAPCRGGNRHRWPGAGPAQSSEGQQGAWFCTVAAVGCWLPAAAWCGGGSCTEQRRRGGFGTCSGVQAGSRPVQQVAGAGPGAQCSGVQEAGPAQCSGVQGAGPAQFGHDGKEAVEMIEDTEAVEEETEVERPRWRETEVEEETEVQEETEVEGETEVEVEEEVEEETEVEEEVQGQGAQGDEADVETEEAPGGEEEEEEVEEVVEEDGKAPRHGNGKASASKASSAPEHSEGDDEEVSDREDAEEEEEVSEKEAAEEEEGEEEEEEEEAEEQAVPAGEEELQQETAKAQPSKLRGGKLGMRQARKGAGGKDTPRDEDVEELEEEGAAKKKKKKSATGDAKGGGKSKNSDKLAEDGMYPKELVRDAWRKRVRKIGPSSSLDKEALDDIQEELAEEDMLEEEVELSEDEEEEAELTRVPANWSAVTISAGQEIDARKKDTTAKLQKPRRKEGQFIGQQFDLSNTNLPPVPFQMVEKFGRGKNVASGGQWLGKSAPKEEVTRARARAARGGGAKF